LWSFDVRILNHTDKFIILSSRNRNQNHGFFVKLAINDPLQDFETRNNTTRHLWSLLNSLTARLISTHQKDSQMKLKIPLCITALLNNSCSLPMIRISNAKPYELIKKTNAVKVRSQVRR